MTPLVTDAVLSACGRYRYYLTRLWDASRPLVGWLMLNPSTADHSQDDPTVRRCIAFARRWNYGGIAVANLFAWRATDPRDLLRVADPIGPENRAHLRRLASECGGVVAAWGASLEPLLHKFDPLYTVWCSFTRLECLGRTRARGHGPRGRDGFPRHPLYVRADTELVPFWKARSEP